VDVTRGLLDVLEPRQLTALLAHEAAHIRAGDALGPVLVWLGALPIVALWGVSWAIWHLSRLLAYFVGIALIVPALVFPAWFKTWFGGLLAALIILIVGLWLIAVGVDTATGVLSAAGTFLLVAWLVVPAMRALLAFETRARESAADRAVAAAGLGEPLRTALELITALDGSADRGARDAFASPQAAFRMAALR
jgi:Zn-dependent protease with chaperone function